MKKNLFAVLAALLFCPVLTAQAQGEVVFDRDALSACQAALADLRAEVVARGETTGMCEATEEDLEAARRACMVQEGMSLSNAQALWRLLNPNSTRVFSSQEEIAAAIRGCRPVITNRCEPEPTPEETPPPTHRAQTFCVYGAEPVWNARHTRITDCTCNSATHMEVRIYGGDPAAATHYDDTYVGCAVWQITGAPPDAPPPGDGLERIIRELVIKVTRLEHQACDRGDNHAGFQALCDRVTHLEEHYREIDRRVTELEREVRELYELNRAICVGDEMSDREWLALTHNRRVELCEDFHRRALIDTTGPASTGVAGPDDHRFLVTVGLTAGYDSASETFPVAGDIRAQYEYRMVDGVWFYLRLETGIGTQNDSAGWLGTVPIADSANWGFGLGASFDVSDHVILSAGASYHGLLNPGPYVPGELWGDYRGHSVTGDFGIRLEANPDDSVVVFGELDLSAGWSRVFGERNNDAVPLDGALFRGSFRIGLRF